MSPRVPSTARAWLRRAAFALLALEALYLLAGNLFLNLPVGQHWINRKPQKFRIEWDGGRTLLPGFVEVHGLQLRSQTQSVQWYLSLDRVHGHLWLTPLLRRRLQFSSARVHGVDFRLRRRLDFLATQEAGDGDDEFGDEAGVRLEGENLAPEIPGFENPPDPPPEEISASPRRERGWILDFRNVAADSIHQIWIEKARYVADEAGGGHLRGRLRTELRGEMEMPAAHLALSGGELRLGDERIASNIELDAEARFHRFVPQENRGRDALRFLSGTLDLEAQLAGAHPIDFFFRSARWISIDGDGPLDAHLAVDHGVLAEGTEVRIGPGEIAVRYLDYVSHGEGTVTGSVEAGEGATVSRVDTTLDRFELRRQGEETPHIRGEGFRLAAQSEQLSLFEPKPNVEVEVELPKSQVVDLGYYNAFLPPDSGLTLDDGTGTIEGSFRFSTGEATGDGSLDLNATALQAHFEEIGLRGDVSIRGRFPHIDVKNRRFSLDGSEIRLDRVSVDGASVDDDEITRDWWLRLRMPSGQVRFSQPLDVETDFTATLRDSRPIVALLVEKKSILDWIDGLLSIEGIAAQGEVTVTDQSIRLRELELSAEGLELLAEIELRAKQRDGVLFLRLGPLSAAVELHGGERNWKLLNSRAWYRDRVVARQGASGDQKR